MTNDIPKFEELMLPILKMFEDGEVHTRSEIKEKVFKNYTPEQLSVLIPSGKRGVIADRTSWALQYLRSANALETTSRGEYKISGNGKKLLSDNLDEITVKTLKQFPEFDLLFRSKNKKENEDVMPDDAIRNIIAENDKIIKKEIINNIMQKDPFFLKI